MSRKACVWHLLSRCTERVWLFCAACGDGVRYAPLSIFHIRLNTSVRCREAEKYLLRENCEGLPPAERLRWCRYRAGLLQREVAERVGITRAVYADMENGIVAYWRKETMDKLAELFGVAAEELLDGYQRFLASGQRRQIEDLRQSMGLTKSAFARYLGVSHALLRDWTTERKRVSKGSWERYFEGKG